MFGTTIGTMKSLHVVGEVPAGGIGSSLDTYNGIRYSARQVTAVGAHDSLVL